MRIRRTHIKEDQLCCLFSKLPCFGFPSQLVCHCHQHPNTGVASLRSHVFDFCCTQLYLAGRDWKAFDVLFALQEVLHAFSGQTQTCSTFP